MCCDLNRKLPLWFDATLSLEGILLLAGGKLGKQPGD
jgi:hypothetical protein